MGRTIASLFLVVLVRGADGCDLPKLNACVSAANLVVDAGITATQGKPALCLAMETFTTCFTTNAADCDLATMATYQANLMATRNKLSGTFGVECLMGTAPTAIPLASGDSGSPSGSATVPSGSGSSGGYGLLTWQLILLVLFCVCCVCGGGGGGGYYAFMQNKKGVKRGAKAKGLGSGRPDYDMEQPLQEVQPQYEEPPMASAIVDTGYGQEVVTGVDMDRDGIPDVLEQNPGFVQPLQPMVPMVQSVEVEQVAEAQPMLFGPVANLLPGMTSSTITTAAPGQYSTVGAYSAAPTYGAYGAYGGAAYAAAPGMTSNYYSSAANPTYATTSYAAPGAYTGAGAVI